jgi:8-oxo-dGTP pyrophosphatase MutT (NUDIX family)
METVHQISAGGVAHRSRDVSIEVALIKTVSEGRWQLPKGIIDPGETPEIAALREVREEAGIACEIIEPLEVIEYWFVAAYDDGPKRRYHKKVHFYLMKFISGDVADHDHEVSEARWFEINEAENMLAFESEKNLVAAARRRLEGTE